MFLGTSSPICSPTHLQISRVPHHPKIGANLFLLFSKSEGAIFFAIHSTERDEVLDHRWGPYSRPPLNLMSTIKPVTRYSECFVKYPLGVWERRGRDRAPNFRFRIMTC
jgi:hypothetical protein